MPMYGYQRPAITDSSSAIEPKMEHHLGDNFPYRGIEDHGVPITEKPDPVDAEVLDYCEDGEFDYPRDIPAQDPVPVIVVNMSQTESKEFIAVQYSISGVTPVRIAAQDRFRTRIRLMATLDNVFIGHTDSVNTNTGILLPITATSYQELITTDQVYAMCAVGDTATLYVIFERTTNLDTVENKTK